MNSSSSSETAKIQLSQSSSGPKSLTDFLSMKGTLKCTFSDNSNTSSGTVYVSNGEMRGDFQSAMNGTIQHSHMVNDGTYIYYWSDGQKGYKMSLASVKSETSQISGAPAPSAANPGGMNMHQKANYSCGPWAVNGSVFTPPSNVTFTDYSSMMQGSSSGISAQQGSSSMHGTAAECSECNQAPAGAARNQCLSALHCQ